MLNHLVYLLIHIETVMVFASILPKILWDMLIPAICPFVEIADMDSADRMVTTLQKEMIP